MSVQPGEEKETRMTRKEILADLNTRQISADSRRDPGAGTIYTSQENQKAWWNGFYWGLQIAIDRLEGK